LPALAEALARYEAASARLGPLIVISQDGHLSGTSLSRQMLAQLDRDGVLSRPAQARARLDELVPPAARFDLSPVLTDIQAWRSQLAREQRAQAQREQDQRDAARAANERQHETRRSRERAAESPELDRPDRDDAADLPSRDRDEP
jgi:hypothetical protein